MRLCFHDAACKCLLSEPGVFLPCFPLLPASLTCRLPLLSSVPVCARLPLVKEYVTVGQLNQMYGMPKVESSPTSPLRQQPLQCGAVDPAFSCLPSPHGSSLSLAVEVCVLSLLLLSSSGDSTYRPPTHKLTRCFTCCVFQLWKYVPVLSPFLPFLIYLYYTFYSSWLKAVQSSTWTPEYAKDRCPRMQQTMQCYECILLIFKITSLWVQEVRNYWIKRPPLHLVDDLLYRLPYCPVRINL